MSAEGARDPCRRCKSPDVVQVGVIKRCMDCRHQWLVSLIDVAYKPAASAIVFHDFADEEPTEDLPWKPWDGGA